MLHVLNDVRFCLSALQLYRKIQTLVSCSIPSSIEFVCFNIFLATGTLYMQPWLHCFVLWFVKAEEYKFIIKASQVNVVHQVSSANTNLQMRVVSTEAADYQQIAYSQPCTLAQIQAKEADVQALAELTCALEKKVNQHSLANCCLCCSSVPTNTFDSIVSRSMLIKLLFAASWSTLLQFSISVRIYRTKIFFVILYVSFMFTC